MVYSNEFFQAQRSGSYQSASIVVPLVKALVPVTSVCDVGCGVGTWLRAWMESGVSDTLGLDGPYVESMLQIPRSHFRPTDLREKIHVGRRFDLAMSVEVAEHLPSSRADSFVADLVSLAPAVLFSAAIPLQGGTGHINERWQSDWAEMFQSKGYATCDVVRPQIWTNKLVEVWYRQNTILYLDRSVFKDSSLLTSTKESMISVVHPDTLTGCIDLDGKRHLLPHLKRSLRFEFKRFMRKAQGKDAVN